MTRFCVNIAFLGAVCILATSLHHRMQNDWTSIQQVTAHWWLPRHSTLDLLANSVWSQLWLRTPPQHYKSSQWRTESGQPNKHASCHYFSLYGDTHPQSLIFVYYSWSRPMSVNKIQIFSGVCVCVCDTSTFIPSLVPAINRFYYRLLYAHHSEKIDHSDKVFNFDCLFHQYVMEWAIPR